MKTVKTKIVRAMKRKDFRLTDDSLKNYLKSIKDGELLSAEEEVELSKRIIKGDQEARKRFINANLRLVVKIARNYVTPGMDLLDLIQEGNLGLIKATDKFDFRKNARFSTYASFWIKQSITRAISSKSRFIRLPHRKDEKLRRVTKVQSKISREKGREPNIEELSKEANLTEEEVKTILNLPDNVVSIESSGKTDEGYDLHNIINDDKYNPDRYVLRNYLREKAKEMLEILSEREKKVLFMRYSFFTGQKYTLKEIGEELSTSPETVRQIELRALRKIREHFAHLKEFLSDEI